MNSGQKVIVCVAIGAVMVVLGFAARAWWWETPGSGGGWFNYAPNNGVIYTFDGPDGQSILTQALIWIGLVVRVGRRLPVHPPHDEPRRNDESPPPTGELSSALQRVTVPPPRTVSPS